MHGGTVQQLPPRAWSSSISRAKSVRNSLDRAADCLTLSWPLQAPGAYRASR